MGSIIIDTLVTIVSSEITMLIKEVLPWGSFTTIFLAPLIPLIRESPSLASLISARTALTLGPS